MDMQIEWQKHETNAEFLREDERKNRNTLNALDCTGYCVRRLLGCYVDFYVIIIPTISQFVYGSQR